MDNNKLILKILESVREVAAQAFDVLYKVIGSKSLDEILPPLLDGLEKEGETSNALDGLRQILSVRGNIVLPFIVPRYHLII